MFWYHFDPKTLYNGGHPQPIGVGWYIAIGIFEILAIARIISLILNFRSPAKTKGFGYWRRWVAAFVWISLGTYFFWGMFPNSSFQISKLKGMTKAQVIARFGPPRLQQRAGSPGPTGEELLTFYYSGRFRWGGFDYSVMFGRNGRVKYVLVGSK